MEKQLLLIYQNYINLHKFYYFIHIPSFPEIEKPSDNRRPRPTSLQLRERKLRIVIMVPAFRDSL